MLSISHKTKLSVSQARILVESFVLVIGFILGGPVFIATFLYTLIQSPVFQKSLLIFKNLVEVFKNKEKQIREDVYL